MGEFGWIGLDSPTKQPLKWWRLSKIYVWFTNTTKRNWSLSLGQVYQIFPILMLYLTYKRLHFIMFSKESLLLLNMQWLHHPQTCLSSSRFKKRQEERGLQIYIDAETNSDKNENTNLKMFKIFHLACCPFIRGCHRETHWILKTS